MLQSVSTEFSATFLILYVLYHSVVVTFNSVMESNLSSRGARIAAYRGVHRTGFDMYIKDPFNKENNPQGILNFGNSENKLCYDILEERLSRAQANCLTPELLQYSDLQGLRGFREETADFLTEYCRAPTPLNPEHIVVLNGCTSALAALTTVLMEPGDGYLIPSPYYGGIATYTWLYGEVNPVPVPLDSKISRGKGYPLMLAVDKLEDAMSEATKKGIRVRGLILTNPHNPLGVVYPAEVLMDCLEFAHRYKLHVIVDEIYMLSVYDGKAFTSIHSFESLPDPERTHVLWGFSKDFALAGLRVGTVHTRNQEVRRALIRLASFHSCAGPTQQLLTHLLQDRDWINTTFLPSNRRRLLESRAILVKGLQDIGVSVLKSSAGFFVWADLRSFLKEQSFEAEMDLWWRLIHEKVFISPGQVFSSCEPGWFRVVFSDTVENIKIGVDRIKKALGAPAIIAEKYVHHHAS
nr:PREDICTED: 1-aminocyclopropane-1-carboxylate synthase-like protein 1 isoform X1 [Lepisosteus oculatus]